MKIKTLSVSELNSYIKKILDNDFILNNLSVKGEISNLKYHSSGHIYFSLKDDSGKINCIMFKNKAYELAFNLEDGMNVIVRGKVSAYEANGTFQIYCNEIEKEGLGDLYIRYEQLKKKLELQGYFDLANKKPIPKEPVAIGIVTSSTGAAIEDIKNVIRRRNRFVDLFLYPAQVQGKGAFKSIIDGIRYFNNKKNVDLIIVGRGGGSIEELWNFNEEALAEEIFHSEIPIISAVGHEVDYTIADFVADLRASTPSQAGELAVPLDSEIYFTISEYENYLNKYMIERFNDEKSKINNFSKILSLNSPMNKVVNSYLEVEKVKEKLDSLLNKKIALEKQKLISLNNVLQAHSPLNILSKGYAIIEDENGKIIKSKDFFDEKKKIKDFNKDMNVKINLSDGIIKGNLKLL